MIDLSEMITIEDFSNDTLIALADRLEQSTTFQELLVREAELDEIYRRVELPAVHEPETSKYDLAEEDA